MDKEEIARINRLKRLEKELSYDYDELPEKPEIELPKINFFTDTMFTNFILELHSHYRHLGLIVSNDFFSKTVINVRPAVCDNTRINKVYLFRGTMTIDDVEIYFKDKKSKKIKYIFDGIHKREIFSEDEYEISPEPYDQKLVIQFFQDSKVQELIPNRDLFVHTINEGDKNTNRFAKINRIILIDDLIYAVACGVNCHAVLDKSHFFRRLILTSGKKEVSVFDIEHFQIKSIEELKSNCYIAYNDNKKKTKPKKRKVRVVPPFPKKLKAEEDDDQRINKERIIVEKPLPPPPPPLPLFYEDNEFPTFDLPPVPKII